MSDQSDSPPQTIVPSRLSAPVPDENVEIAGEQSEGLDAVFTRYGISLLISTYQAGKLIIARCHSGKINLHLRDSPRPMGIAVNDRQLAVGVSGEILFYADVDETCSKLQPPGKHDACFIQRYGHLTGEIDVHEMAFGGDGQIWFINTRFSALCTIQGSTSFFPVWRPPFISAYAAEDRCHLNGLCMMNGKPRYVTALGETDKPAGWRKRKADGGVLIDLQTGKVLCRGLSMPHSPRWYANQLWVCESGKGTLSKVDYVTGEVTPFFEFPGFTRGVDFHGPLAFVGLSQIRETATFSGLPITERIKEQNCGVWIIDIRNGSLVGTIRFTEGVQEIFAVQTLVGLRYPEILDKTDPLVLESYFLPQEIAAEAHRSEAARMTSSKPKA